MIRAWRTDFFNNTDDRYMQENAKSMRPGQPVNAEVEREVDTLARRASQNLEQLNRLNHRLYALRTRLYGEGKPSDKAAPTPLYQSGMVGDLQRLTHDMDMALGEAHDTMEAIERFA